MYIHINLDYYRQLKERDKFTKMKFNIFLRITGRKFRIVEKEFVIVNSNQKFLARDHSFGIWELEKVAKVLYRRMRWLKKQFETHFIKCFHSFWYGPLVCWEYVRHRVFSFDERAICSICSICSLDIFKVSAIYVHISINFIQLLSEIIFWIFSSFRP